jgi:hypothetical protein
MSKKVLLILFFLSALFVVFKFVFVVRSVECVAIGESLTTTVCPKVQQGLLGKSLFFTDFENDPLWIELAAAPEYSHTYQFAWIKKYALGRVSVGLTSKLPDYRLVIGEKRFIFNQTNRVRNDQDFLELLTIEAPNLSAEDSLQQGYLAEDYHRQFLNLATSIREQKLAIQQAVWRSDQEIQLLLPALTVVIDTQKDFFWQMERLRAILDDQDVAIALQQATTLDLRFNLPVLK